MAIQILTVLLGVIGASALLREASAWRSLYAPTAALLLLPQLLFRGLYWPMFPAYAVVAVCACLLPFHRHAPHLEHRRRGQAAMLLAFALCLGSLAITYILPAFTLPAPTGTYAVGTRTEHWTDPATHRELAVQIWYPAVAAGSRARYIRLRESRPTFIFWHWIRTNSYQDAPVASASEPFPVLLFGHMWGGRRTQDTFLAEDLASHGFVVLAPDHPGNAARVELANGSVLRSDRAGALSNPESAGVAGIHAVWASELILWTADNEYVLGQLAAGQPAWLAGRLDMDRVGAFGHSFGGAASMALLGLDPRVRSAVNLDGWTFGGLDHRTSQPVLFLYEARDEGMAGGTPTTQSADDQLERADREIVDRSLASGGGFRGYVLGTQHADFTDQTLVSPIERLTYTGPIHPDRARTITRGVVLAFFNQTLKGTGSVPEYPEVKAVVLPAR